MVRVTTPKHRFRLPIDTSTCKVIQLTYEQGNYKLVKQYENGSLPEGMTLDGYMVIQRLTQEETKAFKKGPVKAQIRVLTNEDDVLATPDGGIRVNVDETTNEEILI